MNTFSNGQLSNCYCFAQNFGMVKATSTPVLPSLKHLVFTVILFIITMFGATPASKAAPSFSETECQTNFELAPNGISWSVSMRLECALSQEGSLNLQSLFTGLLAFSGFGDKVTLSTDRKTITYYLTGPTSELPANFDVALITVFDANCGGTRKYLVHTDGGATILVIDAI